MNYNDHSKIEGCHAFLSPSQYHWLNYDNEKLIETFHAMQAKEKGTQLHAFAASCIKLGQKLPRSTKTLNAYVNDAIGYHLIPEQTLFFSEYCFGTADAITQLDHIIKTGTVRIQDLKTGQTKASMNQLLVYAALLCLEYSLKPAEFKFDLNIYQCDDVFSIEPTVEDILPIMNKIITFNKALQKVKLLEA